MKGTRLYILTWLALGFIALYSLLFIFLHFRHPYLGNITITPVPDIKYGIQYITLTTDKPTDLFYFLIYEESHEENWIYYSAKSYNDNSSLILSQFLPKDKQKYILLEGNAEKSSFSFSLKPKYNLTTLANKDHIFHVVYIEPLKIPFFPTFYYTQHSVFFIDPIL